MRRTRRHRFLKLSIFFLIYSIYHVILVHSENKEETHSLGSDHEKPNEHSLPETIKPEPEHPKQKTDTHENPQEDTHKTKGTKDNKFSHFMKSATEGGHRMGESIGKHINNTETAEKKENHTKTTKENKSETEGGNTLTSSNKNKVTHSIGSAIGIGKNVIDDTTKIMANVTAEDCVPAAIKQNLHLNFFSFTMPLVFEMVWTALQLFLWFPRPLMSPTTRRHGGLIIHTIVAIYMFIGLAIVCDEYFVASLDRICEELKMSPDVAGATFMAAGSSAPELATVIIGVFYAEDDIGISGVIGSAVFNIMFVISVCALATGAVIYLNWWPLIRDCTFYAISILVMLAVIGDEYINWYESLIMLITYFIYCVVLRFNTSLERWAMTLPVPFKKTAPNEQSGLVSFKKLEDEANKHPNYGIDQVETIVPEKQWSPGLEWGDWSPEKQQQRQVQQDFERQPVEGPALNQTTNNIPSQEIPVPAQHEYYRPKEYDPSAYINPLLKPTGGAWAHIKWVTLYPIHFLCIHTTPNCRTEKYKNWYAFTFLMSMLWISFYSYFMVWMITIIGYTLSIPDTVMGLTFVAAGVSVPDALSSIAVIKEGYGDMAVSNAIGSNVFDILICLGLPWFLKTAIVYPGTRVRVISKGLTYSTFSLLSTVVFLVVAIHYNGWKLDRRFGIVLMVWYLVFITFASLYELNIFADWNKMECPTDW